MKYISIQKIKKPGFKKDLMWQFINFKKYINFVESYRQTQSSLQESYYLTLISIFKQNKFIGLLLSVREFNKRRFGEVHQETVIST